MASGITRRELMAVAAVGAGGCAAAAALAGRGGSKGPIRAGASAVDVTPEKFPVIVNGGFTERKADRAHDRLHARCLVIESGPTRIAIAVVDNCLMPRDVLDAAKAAAEKATGIPAANMLISATHTHSAPAAVGALGCPVDPAYPKYLPGRIAEGIARAAKNVVAAEVGFTAVDVPRHTNCRRWILRPDHMRTDPFGGRTVRAMMHPGYQNPSFVGPAGPIDPAMTLLAVRSAEGRPIALMANYSMHYFGSPALSADYFGVFAAKIKEKIGEPAFVGIMSQGTSGDLHWMDYSRPRRSVSCDAYAAALAQIAAGAYKKLEFHRNVPLAMRERELTLSVRRPDEKRLAWARTIIAEMAQGRKHGTFQRVYSREQIHLHENPTHKLKLQAVRIGDLGIAAMPCEVFGITGLKIKAASPLKPTMNFELANGADGYIPPPEQHALGGYTTWEARSACLEIGAEPKIVEAVVGLLEEVSGKGRRKLTTVRGPYAKAVLASGPAAYWRMQEIRGPKAVDASGKAAPAVYEPGVAFYLSGPPSAGRAAHFAGGRLAGCVKGLAKTYTVELWFWNGLPARARAVTGYLLSRGPGGAKDAPGDHLGIGGTHAATGRLIFFNGNRLDEMLPGKTEIQLRTWHHVAMVRDGEQVTVYLDGKPEITGRSAVSPGSGAEQVFLGGRTDNFANFEGKIADAAVYARALRADEVAAHFAAARA